ncbi:MULTISPECIES: hypothetical protein [Listeria]|uniref:Uncharacterized protein n=1 Tax=Listeria riparia FSL S10-1204 TaxID=1265816 RepID=W7DCB8_9LIST|nr:MULTISPECIES: hypothetical protein [Listeria]EUJ42923.1 hypothetical protein PRIP_14757 [Listeria riparia FSL S10-1204]MBC2164650.1 hypothetical protein [Listeria booriae]
MATLKAKRDMAALAKKICEAQNMDYEDYCYARDLELVTNNMNLLHVGTQPTKHKASTNTGHGTVPTPTSSGEVTKHD